MKKTLLAVAVAAALPAVAFAQTNVTLYGIADAGIGWNDSGASGKSSTVVVNSGYQSTSRFGVRGTEDLGSGLKATFNLESGVKFDTGATDDTVNFQKGTQNTFWQRRAVVGLAGGFGEVRLGRDYTPGFSAAGTTDVMGYGLLGNWLTFTAGAGGITTRASNGLHYTGTFGGVTVRAMYATGENVDPRSAGDMYGVSAVYVGGPLTVQGYWQQLKTNTPLNAATNNKSIDQAGIGAGYNFGGFRLTLTYGISDPDNALEAGMGKKTQGLGLGAGVKVGVGEVLAQVMQLKTDVVAGTDPKATVFGIAYVHPLSKRTNLYATFGTARNNSAGTFAVLASDNSVAPVNPGDDPKGFAVGIRHLF